jgi:hypothetical protein
VWVDAAGHSLETGQAVVIGHDDSQMLGTVAVAADQIIDNEAGAGPVGEVVRLASEDDVRNFGRRGAAALHATAAADAVARDLGVGPVGDAWLAPDGARLNLVLAAPPDSASSTRYSALASRLAAELGLVVLVLAGTSTGSLRPLSGIAAGLPSGSSEWLAPPGAEPFVRDARDAAPSAADFIARYCPVVERPARRFRQDPENTRLTPTEEGEAG